jgi:phospholipid transport system substrate-binding protein
MKIHQSLTGTAPLALLATLLIGVWLALLPVRAAADTKPAAAYETPEEMVREMSKAVLDLAEEARGYVDQDRERFFRQVEDLLNPVVDFDSFARSVMATHYRKASPDQRRRFIDSFRSGLVRTYAMALMDFKDGRVVVVPPEREPRDPARRTVKMEVHTAGQVWPVLYSVSRGSDGAWQVRNLIVNGVNMGLTYRNQFSSAVSQQGGNLDAVIQAWADIIEAEAPDFDTGSAE